jgi:signal peptidase I
MRCVVVLLAVAAFVGAGVGFGARTPGLQPMRIASDSMSPAVSRGDWVAVGDVGREHRHAPRHGDIVLLPFLNASVSPPTATTRLIARPVVPSGHLNYDSRGFGPVPESEIVGRVRAVVTPPGWLLATLASVSLLATGLALVRRLPRSPRLTKMAARR